MIFISELTTALGAPITLLVILAIILVTWWIVLFVGFTVGFREEIDVGKYFRAMILVYKKTELRWLWRAILLILEYTIGLIALVIIKSAWYAAQAVRWTIFKILFSTKKKKELQKIRELADK